MKKIFVSISFILFLFLGITNIYSEEPIVDLGKEQQKNSWMPEDLVKLSNRLLELNAQIEAINEYSPEKSPDFKNLQKINQLVDELEFNNRKFELLIKKYKLIEDEIFEYMLDYSKQDKNLKNIRSILDQYKKKGVNSLLNFQKSINRVALKIERLKRDISQLQFNAKTNALNTDIKKKSEKDLDSMTNLERIQRYKEDLKKLKKELIIEEKLIKDQEKKKNFKFPRSKKRQLKYQSLKLNRRKVAI